MSGVNLTREADIRLSYQEFRIVTMALTGKPLGGNDKQIAQEIGIRLLEQYVKALKDQLEGVSGAVMRAKERIEEE